MTLTQHFRRKLCINVVVMLAMHLVKLSGPLSLGSEIRLFCYTKPV